MTEIYEVSMIRHPQAHPVRWHFFYPFHARNHASREALEHMRFDHEASWSLALQESFNQLNVDSFPVCWKCPLCDCQIGIVAMENPPHLKAE